MPSEKILKSGKYEQLKTNLNQGDTSLDKDQSTHQTALADLIHLIADCSIDALGYRVVHGGEKFTQATLIDDAVIEQITLRVADAPLHNPFALLAINTLRDIFSTQPHIAVFDTAFHSSMPRRATSYAINRDVSERFGIKRFGFHGISHAYVSSLAANALGTPISDLRLVTLHLGNGASACAVEFGRSAETSMGNTPLEGLVMGSRSGDVDAGVLLNLLRSGEYDVETLHEMLNQHSGLAGLSGIGNDLREIEAAAQKGHDGARLAINVYAHRVRKYIGAFAAVMGGVDAVVFTGGVGENSAGMRRRIVQRLEFLGLHLDEDANLDVNLSNSANTALISAEHSRVAAIVVKTNEELMIAQQTAVLVKGTKTAPTVKLHSIPIAISGRHAHLTAETFTELFGKTATLTPYKALSQPGQFAAEQTIDIVGPRKTIEHVRVLNPLRKVNQIEISRTDEFTLGVDAPVRDSGQVVNSAPISIRGPEGIVHLKEGLICARRHVHMHPTDAKRFGVIDRQEIAICISGGERDLIFGDVLIRVHENYKLEMHIDTDEANACELNTSDAGDVVYQDVDDVRAQPV